MRNNETLVPNDQIDLVVKARAIFNEAYENYKKVMSIKPKKIKDQMKAANDHTTGGEWSILELIEITVNSMNKDKELLESFIWKIQPIRREGSEIPEHKFLLTFSLMKIWNKIAKMGKDVKYLYQTLDKDGGGTLDPQEILDGLKLSFNLYFSQEEAKEVCSYLDSDGSGDVDFDEFQEKINYNNYTKYYHCFLISKQHFIELVLNEWQEHKQREFEKLMKKFEEFDDNGDGVLTFEEFETLVNNLDPSISRENISELFNETLEMNSDDDDPDKMSPEAFWKTAIGHRLGGFGTSFFTDYLIQKKIKPDTRGKILIS